jgi:hypothetical protein
MVAVFRDFGSQETNWAQLETTSPARPTGIEANQDGAEPDLGTLSRACFTPVLAKHSESFSLIDCISVGVDRMQRNFEPIRRQVEAWQRSERTMSPRRWSSIEAFVEGQLELPSTLPAQYITFTLTRDMRSLSRGRFAVSRTHSAPHSRSWSPCRNSTRQPSWVSSSKTGSHTCSSQWGGVSRPFPVSKRAMCWQL